MGSTCARCGAEEAPYFAEIPNVAMGSHNTLWLCKQHARELAEIVRLYGEGAHLVSLDMEARPQPEPEETKPAPDALKLIHKALALIYCREFGAFGKDGSIERTLDELEAIL